MQEIKFTHMWETPSLQSILSIRWRYTRLRSVEINRPLFYLDLCSFHVHASLHLVNNAVNVAWHSSLEPLQFFSLLHPIWLQTAHTHFHRYYRCFSASSIPQWPYFSLNYRVFASSLLQIFSFMSSENITNPLCKIINLLF